MVVKIITSTDLRTNLSDAIDEVGASNEPILVRRSKDVDAALVSIDMLEDLLELKDKDYVETIKAARKDIREGHYLSFDEVFGG